MPAEKKVIWYICDRCGGTGYEQNPEPFEPNTAECIKCNGSGKLYLGEFDELFLGDLDSIKDNVDIVKDELEIVKAMVQDIKDFHGI